MIPGHNLMIVAHCDDETIFGHSQLISGDWEVVVVCSGERQYRIDEFKTVMYMYGKKYYILDNPDGWDDEVETYKVKEKLFNIGIYNYDNILTHNPEGEYGHPQHKQIYKIVNSLIDRNLWLFNLGSYMPFKILESKINMLHLYKSQYDLNAFDWYNQNDLSNTMMNWIVFENSTKVK
jgi:hypothetical protein